MQLDSRTWSRFAARHRLVPLLLLLHLSKFVLYHLVVAPIASIERRECLVDWQEIVWGHKQSVPGHRQCSDPRFQFDSRRHSNDQPIIVSSSRIVMDELEIESSGFPSNFQYKTAVNLPSWATFPPWVSAACNPIQRDSFSESLLVL